jgi:NAD(P)H-hydrate epimerase
MTKPIYQDKLLYPKILWQRPVHFYKSQAGKIMVLAGSKGMSGAAILTCEAVFRSGTGILVLGFPEGLKSIYKEVLPEAMTLELPETPGHTLAKKAEDLILDNVKGCDVVIIGPGLSQNAETTQLIWELVFSIERPIVLDADGITAFAKGIEVMREHENEAFMTEYLTKRPNELIITPHPGEAAKLCTALKLDKKYTNKYVDEHKDEIATILADKLACTVVLKGYHTVIATNTGDAIITRVGGPELATAGSGDVLSGIIGSFVGQNPEKHLEAIATAVFLHAKAGELAKEKVGERSVIASDIIRYLPIIIKELENA